MERDSLYVNEMVGDGTLCSQWLDSSNAEDLAATLAVFKSSIVISAHIRPEP